MRKVGIVTDSHSGILPAEAEKLQIAVLPMPFYCGEESYYEGVSITREEFMEKLNADEKVSTSQANPQELMDLWRKELETYEELVYIPLSSGLSGSCSTAQAMAMDEEFENRVFVVDNGKIAILLHCAVLDALALAEQGLSGKEIRDLLEKERDKGGFYIAVETLENLKRGGRISAASAAIGTALNIKPVLKCETGLLYSHKKCRGMKKARKEMLEAMKQDMETTLKEYIERGEFQLLAATSADEETTEGWLEEIRSWFPDMEILCEPLTMGISCHTGAGALGVGYVCKAAK